MANASYQSAPKLSQTTAKENTYSPVSWLAVAGGLATLVFLVLLGCLIVYGLWTRQHVLINELLYVPAVSLALGFAAYQHVKNSEGTRLGTLFGFNLVKFAIWGSLIGGAGYIAYIVAVEFSVNQRAKEELQNWSENFKNLSATDDMRKQFAPIVHKTLEPSSQQMVAATDYENIQNSNAIQLNQIMQSDVARVCVRNPGKVEIKPQGLVSWERMKDAIQCVMNAEMVSPEGVHSLQMKMFAKITSKGQPVWAIENKPNYTTNRSLTDYGLKAEETEYAGMIFGQRWLSQIDAANRIGDLDQREVIRYSAYTDYMLKPLEPNRLQPMFLKQLSASVIGGAVCGELRSDTYSSKLAKDFFTPIFSRTGMSQDAQLKKEESMRNQFAQIWSEGRIVRAGVKLSQSKDTFPVMTFDENRIRVSVPVELVLSMTDTAQARVIVECTDKAAVEELNRLKASADPSKAKQTGLPKLETPTTAWKVINIRSDLIPAASPKMQQGSTEPPGM